MRRAAVWFALIMLAQSVSGCDPVTDRQYYREGAGVELNSGIAADAVEKQRQYFEYICANDACIGGWNAVVRAGMNDIDRRCDAYLAWLDANRRDREPVLRQIATVGAATSSILSIAGAGTGSMGYVAEAFGLIAQSYSNWNSRLLLEVNHSTVTTIVYTRQKDFRADLATKSVTDQPQMVYVLRSYLRLCMPFTIETDINTSITLAQRDAGRMIKDNPLITVAAPLAPRQQIIQVQRTVVSDERYKAFIKNYNPKVHSVATVTRVLGNLCVVDDKDIGDPTREFVKVYQQTKRLTVTGVLTDSELAKLQDEPDCVPNGVRNFYEKHEMPEGIATATMIGEMNRLLKPHRQLPPNAKPEDVRNRIGDLRNDFKNRLTLNSSQLCNQFTPELRVEMRRRLAPGGQALPALPNTSSTDPCPVVPVPAAPAGNAPAGDPGIPGGGGGGPAGGAPGNGSGNTNGRR